jgi:hypothetical protein
MNMSLAHVSLCAALILLPGGVAARTKVTVEQAAIWNVMSAMTLFLHANDNRHPTNWAQVAQVIDMNQINKGLINSPALPLEGHYVFIRERAIPMLGYQEGEVVLIRVGPVSERGRPEAGRYIISRIDGDLKCTWYAERKVQQLLSQPGLGELPEIKRLLPRAGSQPPFPRWPVVAAVVAIAAGVIYALVRRARKRA